MLACDCVVVDVDVVGRVGAVDGDGVVGMCNCAGCGVVGVGVYMVDGGVCVVCDGGVVVTVVMVLLLGVVISLALFVLLCCGVGVGVVFLAIRV